MILLLLICATVLFSCQKPPDPSAAKGQGFTLTILEDAADEELLRITEDARNSLPAFFRQLTRESDDEHSFCVKYPFTADDGSGVRMEEMWLTGIYFENGHYYGKLTGEPRHLRGMEKGDTVRFDVDSVTDWMYVRNGKIIGGLSIRYLLERIPEHERGDGDRELLGMFEWNSR